MFLSVTLGKCTTRTGPELRACDWRGVHFSRDGNVSTILTICSGRVLSKEDKEEILFIGAHTLPSVSGSRSCPSEAWLASRAATSRRPHHLTCRLAQEE